MTPNPPTIGVCVPTCREAALRDFLDAWAPFWDSRQEPKYRVSVFVHEDRQGRQLDVAAWPGLKIVQTAQEDIVRELGKADWIIPRQSGSCRSFPIYLAWKAGCEYIITLDDDCYPEEGAGDRFLADHLESFTRDRWFRTISGDEARGIPYARLGHLPVRMNHGLWLGIPDLDAPTSLVRMRDAKPVGLTGGHAIIPPGMAFPSCAMNVCYHRSIVPAAYNLLMGLGSVGLDRFDDIWSGLLVKRILDYLGWYVTTGEPYVQHVRRSSAFTNLRKEALGIEIHEHFWEHVLDAPLDPGLTVTGAFRSLARHLCDFPKVFPALPCPDGYFPRVAEAMVVWAGLFESTHP